MSKLAVHIDHYKKGAVGSLAGHNWYKRGEKDQHSNQDIDSSRSKDNIALVLPESGSLYKEVKGMVAGATGRVTSASVWVSEWCVYPPESLQDPKTADKAEVERYFRDVLDWMKGQGYHVPLAVVHMDETTIHAHIDTVPLTEDGRLSRKEVYTRAALNNIHTELAKHLAAKGWDLQRGESSKEKQVRSVSVPEYKQQAEAAKLQALAARDRAQQQAQDALDASITAVQVQQEAEADAEAARKAAAAAAEALQIADAARQRAEEEAKRQAQRAQQAADDRDRVRQEAAEIRAERDRLAAEAQAQAAYVDQMREASGRALDPPYVSRRTRGWLHKHEEVTVPAEQWEARYVSADEARAVRAQQESLKGLTDEIIHLQAKHKAAQQQAQRARAEADALRKRVSTLERRIDMLEKWDRVLAGKDVGVAAQILRRCPGLGDRALLDELSRSTGWGRFDTIFDFLAAYEGLAAGVQRDLDAQQRAPKKSPDLPF